MILLRTSFLLLLCLLGAISLESDQEGGGATSTSWSTDEWDGSMMDERTWRSSVDYLVRQGKVTDAIRLVKALLKISPAARPLQVQLAVLQVEEDAGGVISALRNLRRLDPSGSQLLLEAGELVYQGATGAIQELLDEEDRVSPERVLRARRRMKAAEVLYRAAVWQSPGHARCSLVLSRLLLWRGRREESIVVLARALRFLPQDKQMLLDFGIALDRVGMRDESLNVMTMVCKLHPNCCQDRKQDKRVRSLQDLNLSCGIQQVVEPSLGEIMEFVEERFYNKSDLKSLRGVLEMGGDRKENDCKLSVLQEKIGIDDMTRAASDGAPCSPQLLAADKSIRRLVQRCGGEEWARRKLREQETRVKLLLLACKGREGAAEAKEAEQLRDRALVLQTQGKLEEAMKIFQEAVRLYPADAESHNAFAVACWKGGYLDLAARHSEIATRLKPDSRFYVNLGAALYEMRKFAESIEAFQSALRLKEDDDISRFNLANALTEVHMFKESIRHFRRVIEINPTFLQAQFNMIRNMETICDWGRRDERFLRAERILRKQLLQGEVSMVRPWHSLSYPFPPELLLAISRSFANHTRSQVLQLGYKILTPTPRHPNQKRRLKVAYVSYCFSSHPTTYLIGGIFRHHRRIKLDVHCVSLSASDGSQLRQRVEQDCETFLDESRASSNDVAMLLNRLEVHVAINLDGWTSMGRTNEIFVLNGAPVQVQYMGFPGSMGVANMQWLVTDKIISPPEFASHYGEKLALLPHSYYANDYLFLFGKEKTQTQVVEKKRKKKKSVMETRRQFGLPGRGVVFANFNNLYKVSPELFKLWTEILRRAPNSSLALLSLPEDAVQNLKKEFSTSGVSLSRISFLPMLPRDQHVLRSSHASIFLDSLLVNAHTTALDVVWSSLPLVTTPHVRFASRVASSILTTTKCTATIARNTEDYVDVSINLASSKPKMKEIRRCYSTCHDLQNSSTPNTLSSSSSSSSASTNISLSPKHPCMLFDTKRWVEDFERLLLLSWETHVMGRALDRCSHIKVS